MLRASAAVDALVVSWMIGRYELPLLVGSSSVVWIWSAFGCPRRRARTSSECEITEYRSARFTKRVGSAKRILSPALVSGTVVAWGPVTLVESGSVTRPQGKPCCVTRICELLLHTSRPRRL